MVVNSINMQKALDAFDKQYSGQIEIDSTWYKKELGVVSYGKPAPTKSVSGVFSEEYVRARFVYALISTGKYKPELLCVEAQLPKGNGGKSINPDILAFRDNTWMGNNFASSDIRQNILVVFEAKRNAKNDTKSVIEKQLRTSMNEYEGDPSNEINFVFGVYFDDCPNILIFKKENNHPIKRHYPDKIRPDDQWNIGNRDDVNSLPSYNDFINRIISLKNKDNLKVENLEPIDEDAFADLLEPLNRAKDKSGVSDSVHALIVEFLTYKVYDEKYSAQNKTSLRFYITRSEIESS